METNLSLESLRQGLQFFHLPSDERSLAVYNSYFAFLREWNTRMNLVSAGEMDRFVEYHVLDSLKMLVCADFTNVHRLLDFGSGAGLPGIPLAIALPHCQITLIESRLKRATFLSAVVSALAMPNVTVLRGRAEELPKPLQSSFDAVVTRATVSLSSFVHICSGLIKPSGMLVSIKGEDIFEEVEAFRKSMKWKVFNIQDRVPVVPEKVRPGHVIIISS